MANGCICRLILVILSFHLITSTYHVMANVVDFDYSDALDKCLLFFEAQRSGKLPSNQRIQWRGDSGLTDGLSENVDLVGGYYDAGDHVKFGLPMAYSVTMMAWAAIDFSTHLVGANQMENTLEAIRWGSDYFIKAHPEDNVLWAQVGEGESDHKCWERAEDMTTPRTAYQLDSSKPGSDLAGETAAALAAASLAFQDCNSSYSSLLLYHAKQVFSFADNFRGCYDNSIVDAAAFYPSSGYSDELLWAAAWLYRATNDEYYLQYTMDNAIALNGTEQDVKIFSWDNKYAGLQILLSKILLDGNDQSYTSTLKKYKAKADYFACAYMQKNDGANVPMTPSGLAYLLPSINLQYAASAAFLLAIYSDYLACTSSVIECPDGHVHPQHLLDFSKSQADYILGKNPESMSYLVGYGTKYPEKAHHRGSSIPSKSIHAETVGCDEGFSNWYKSPDPNPNLLHGALVGGPDSNDCFTDERDNYDQNEATTCASAPLIGLFSKLQSLSSNAGSNSEETYAPSTPLGPPLAEPQDTLAPTSSLSPDHSGEKSPAPDGEVIADYVLIPPSNLAAVNKRPVAYSVILASFLLSNLVIL